MSNRRELLLLADTFKADKHDPVGMLMSEKLDGMRCFWDGGVSRGEPTIDIPWASVTNPKTGEPKDKVKPVATGLWSRYGNPIMAPEWFLDELPTGQPLDGELYTDRDQFQATMSAIRKDVPIDEEWKPVRYVAFGAPCYHQVFQTGVIKNPQMHCEIDLDACIHMIDHVTDGLGQIDLKQKTPTFHEELIEIDKICDGYPRVEKLDQIECRSFEHLMEYLKPITDAGGEGVMLRDPKSVWFPKRRPFLLKVKPRHDAEATVIGFITGKKGKTGHLQGKLGCLIAEWNGVRFEIGTGLNYENRSLSGTLKDFADKNPGEEVPVQWSSTDYFKLGDQVTFTYMGLSKDGVPREPAFIRIRPEGE